jgi:hypothetical protein
VTWIGSIDNTAGLDWLEDVARAKGQGSTGDSALMALALHRSSEAGGRLHTLAQETHGDNAGMVIFWLGESRGEQGFEILKQLLAELPKGDTRRQINFALAQNQTSAAAGRCLRSANRTRTPNSGARRCSGWLKNTLARHRIG